jgi:hypothetical protein
MELHDNCQQKRVISPVAVGTTGTGQTGKIVDRQGFGALEFILSYGTITATNAVFTATVKEGDVTSSLTSVADADLLGTELLAAPGATATRTSGSSKNCVKRIGYRGSKRYVQVNVKSTVTAVTPISVDGILYRPSVAPVANP